MRPQASHFPSLVFIFSICNKRVSWVKYLGKQTLGWEFAYRRLIGDQYHRTVSARLGRRNWAAMLASADPKGRTRAGKIL